MSKARKINAKVLRERARAKGFKSFEALAERIGCSRSAIYFALERPTRLPAVYEKIEEVCS